MKSKVFVGSSVEGLGIAYAVQENLKYDAEVTVWNQGVFELSKTSIESLQEVLERSDFGIFVFTPDDITKMREKTEPTVRDNVIFELGLFIGKLGRNRTFIIIPEKTELHIPSDLLGVNPGKYEVDRKDGSLVAATGPVCHQIRQQIKKQQILNTSLESPLEKKEEKTEDKKTEDWVNYFLQDDYINSKKAIEIKLKNEKDPDEVIDLKLWELYLSFKINKGLKLEVIKSFVDQNNYSANVYEFISRFLLWEDDFPKAKIFIQEGLEKYPTKSALILLNADYLEKIGDIDNSITILEGTDFHFEEDLSIKLCTLYEEKKDNLNKAREVIHKAYVSNSQSEAVCYKYARIAQDLKEYQIALYLLNELSLKYKQKTEYWGYLSNSCVSLDLNNKALIYCQKANELAQNNESWLQANLGNIYKNSGLYNMALKYFKRGIEIFDQYEYAHKRYSETIALQNEEDESFKSFLAEGRKKILTFECS